MEASFFKLLLLKNRLILGHNQFNTISKCEISNPVDFVTQFEHPNLKDNLYGSDFGFDIYSVQSELKIGFKKKNFAHPQLTLTLFSF